MSFQNRLESYFHPTVLGRKHLWNVLWRLLISSRSVSKHDHHMQFLFLIGRFLKNLLWNCLDKNVHSLERTFHRCFLPCARSFGRGFSEEKIKMWKVNGWQTTDIHILIFFLANLAKGNMSFCHHLVSVVCHPFTFHILIFSSENPRPNERAHGKTCYTISALVNL
jgi:hypothetical protein